MRQILCAGEEPHERTTLVRDVVARRRYRNTIANLADTLRASWRIPHSSAARERLASLPPDITEMLESLRKTLAGLSGAPVSVALKMPVMSSDGQRLEIRTFARDRKADAWRRLLDTDADIALFNSRLRRNSYRS